MDFDIERTIAGRKVLCTVHRDGIQRREWVGVDESGSAQFGAISKSRWSPTVTAVTKDGRTKEFVTSSRGPSVEQAFAEARRWLVTEATS